MIKPRVSTGAIVAGLFWPEFKVIKGCVFLKEAAPARIDTRFPTRTEFDVNHVHLLDHFTHGAGIRREPFYDSQHPDFIAASTLGRTICFMWGLKLRQDFPRWHFRVYFHGFDPIVRFHRVRLRERPVVKDEDWKKAIRSGECMIIDTRKLKS